MFIRNRAMYLRTLGLVVPGTMDLPTPVVPFLPPRRRCRLRKISDEGLDEITISYVPFLEPGEINPMSLRKYLDKQRAGLDRHERHFVVHEDEGTTWSTRDRRFNGLEITAQTFVEYSRAENNQEQWVEVCKGQDRLLGIKPEDRTAQIPRRIPPADRRHPGEYRVLDDDSGWYSMEEYRTDTEREYPEYYHNRSWR
jgi:hypothetical protein